MKFGAENGSDDMADERIRVGLVGCGGISRLYGDIYASLVDIAQVVEVADMVDELAERRRNTISEAYAVEAHRARMMASESRSQEDRDSRRQKAEVAEAAAASKIRKYHIHEGLLKDDEVQVLLTPPTIRKELTVAAVEAGRHVFTQGPMACSVEQADAMACRPQSGG